MKVFAIDGNAAPSHQHQWDHHHQHYNRPGMQCFDHSPQQIFPSTSAPAARIFTISDQLPCRPYDEPVEDEQLPVKNRSSKDLISLLVFILFLVFLGYCIASAILVKKADPNIILRGYDNWGNICGHKNKRLPKVERSGQDMTLKPYLMLIPQTNITFKANCVDECPEKNYFQTAFNRCLPKISVDQYPIVQSAFNITKSLIEKVVADVSLCWKEIIYVSSLSFVISLISLILLRYLVGFIIWAALLGLSLAAVCGTGYVWLIWYMNKEKSFRIPVDSPVGYNQKKVTEHWFVGSLASTVFTLVFLLIVFVMRKRIHLVGMLFREAGKAISAMPFLLIQPIWTFLCLVGICILWIFGLIFIQSARDPVLDNKTGFVSYTIDPFYKYMKWYHIFALIWVSHFIVACQHFVIASTISIWFFTRNKNKLQFPIIRSIYILIRYHLGSVVFGSFLVATVKMLRIFLKKIESMYIKNPLNTFSRCCQCCLWFFQKFLIYINKNAYIEIGAQEAFTLLSSNCLRIAAINSVGDFMLFIAKTSVVCITLLIGTRFLQDRHDQLHYPWSPLLASAIIAYFVAHCFLSVYEMAIEALFICFCEDCKRNDGISRPYSMSSNLMAFVESNGNPNKIRSL